MIVNENTKALDENKGIISSSALFVGDSILCRINGKDIFSKIVSIRHDDTTPQKHKIITNTGSFLRLKGELNTNTLYKPNLKIYKTEDNVFNNNIGWLIGAHMGDGSSNKSNKQKYAYSRVRINGDNENVILKYSKIFNLISGSNCKCVPYNKKHINSKMWQYSVCNKQVEDIINEYFDGQVGNKTTSGIVPNIIREKNLWIPFIAGLIDSDGSIRNNGSIDISICMSKLIDEICIFLSHIGISYKYILKISKRSNELPINRLVIYVRNEIVSSIMAHMAHENKIIKISKGNCLKYTSPHKFKISNNLYVKIMSHKILPNELDYNLMHSLKHLMKKSENEIGLATLRTYYLKGIVNENEYYDILRQEKICKIETDNNNDNYYDVVTEQGVPYFGNFGLLTTE